MIFSEIHRSVPPSAVIMEVSSCIKGEQMQRPADRPGEESKGKEGEKETETLKHTALNGMSHQIPPLKTEGSVCKRRQKDGKCQK